MSSLLDQTKRSQLHNDCRSLFPIPSIIQVRARVNGQCHKLGIYIVERENIITQRSREEHFHLPRKLNLRASSPKLKVYNFNFLPNSSTFLYRYEVKTIFSILSVCSDLLVFPNLDCIYDFHCQFLCSFRLDH